jgi:hypothetical protein
MGWNDHVTYAETTCSRCGSTATWEYWDEVGRARYVGQIGRLLGQDASKPPHCPDCGSTEGEIVDADDEWIGWDD